MPFPGHRPVRCVGVLCLLIVGFSLAGCGAAVEPILPTVRPTLTPSITPIPSATRIEPTGVPSPTKIIPPTPTFGASPTPLLGFAPSPLPYTPTLEGGGIVGGTVRINYFTADALTTQPGSTITLAWSLEGVKMGTIFREVAEGERDQSWVVPGTGTLQVTIPQTAKIEVRFTLLAGSESSPLTQTLSVALACPDGTLPDPVMGCASAPPSGAILPGLVAQQPFQRGLMLWVQSQNRIYVLYEGGEWTSFPDQFREGDAESDPGITPPEGVLQPIRGFGLVWRTQPNVRDRLGWALGTEYAYQTTMEGNASQEGVMTITENTGRVIAIHAGGGWLRR